jgi:hypothetical protein
MTETHEGTTGKLHMRSFYYGILSALAVVDIHDSPTIRDEIIDTVDAKALIREAKRTGSLEWSGLDKYLAEKEEANQ